MYSQQPHTRDYSPSLTVEQFTEACHHLDNIYTRTDLGMLRRRWKLNVYNHFDLYGFQSYVSIKLPVRLPDQQAGDLADALEKFNWNDEAEDSAEFSIDHDAEMADSENLWNSKSTGLVGIMTPKHPTVTYDIIWQPSYGTPRLWFTLNNLPEAYCATDHETVYHLLVPEEQKFIREMGVLGAISLEPHPITSKPAFFVHDCNTTEILTSLAQQRGSKIPLQDYLIIWLGLVGHAVGLSVPLRMGLSIAESYKNSELIGVSWDTDMNNLMQFSMSPMFRGLRLPFPLYDLKHHSSIGESGWIMGNKPANSLFKPPKTIVDPFAGTWGLKPSDLLLEKKVGLLAGEVTTSTRCFEFRSDSMCADRSGIMSEMFEGVDDGREVKRRRTGSVDRDARRLWTLEDLNAVDIDDYWTKPEERHGKHATGNTDLHSHPRITHSIEPSPFSEIDEVISSHSPPAGPTYDLQTLGIEDFSAYRIVNPHPLIKYPNPLQSAGLGSAATQMRPVMTQSNPLLACGLEFVTIPLDDDLGEEPVYTGVGNKLFSLRGGIMSNSSGSDDDSAPQTPVVGRGPTDTYVPATPIYDSGELHSKNPDSEEILGDPSAINHLKITHLDKKRLLDLVDQHSDHKKMPDGNRRGLARLLPGVGKRRLHRSFGIENSATESIHSGEDKCPLRTYEACYSAQTHHSIETHRASRTCSAQICYPIETFHAAKTYETHRSTQAYHLIETCHHSDGTRCPSSTHETCHSTQTHHSIEAYHATRTYETHRSAQIQHSIETCHHSDGTRCPSSTYKADHSAQSHHSIESYHMAETQVTEDEVQSQDLTLPDFCSWQLYLNQRTLKAHIKSEEQNRAIVIERWIQDVLQSSDSETKTLPSSERNESLSKQNDAVSVAK